MISLIKSTFYKEEQTKRELARFVRKARWMSFGAECERFEKRFSKWQGRKECVLVNSGSSANLAMVQALLNLGRLKKGDVVGFSAVTWSTNAMPLIQLGLQPIPVDIDESTLNVGSKQLLEVLKKTSLKMFFLTNVLGLCSDIDEIAKVCKKRKILLIEDNCESLGSEYGGKKLGNFGLASTFSFYVGHHMSTVEGGAVCTDNSRLAEMLRMVRAHGWDRNLDMVKAERLQEKYGVKSSFYKRYTFYDLGYNLRATEVVGFLGNSQLEYLDEIIDKRQKNFEYVAKRLYSNADIVPIVWRQMQVFSSFAIPVICRTKKRMLKMVANCEGVLETRPIVGGNIASQPFFRKHIRNPPMACPRAVRVHNRGFYVGNNPELTRKELDLMVATLSR